MNKRDRLAIELLRVWPDNPISLIDARYPGTMRDASQWMPPQDDPRIRGVGHAADQPLAGDASGGFLEMPAPTLETVFAPPERYRRR